MSHPSAVTTNQGNPLVVVAIKHQGVVLPSTGEHAEHVLDLDEAEAVLSLAAGHRVPEVSPGLAHALEQRGIPVDPAEEDPTIRPASAPTDSSGEVVGEEPLVFPVPTIVRVSSSGFELFDHQGELRRSFSPVELFVAAGFRSPSSTAAVYQEHVGWAGSSALSPAAFVDLIAELRASAVLVPFDPDDPVHASRTRAAEAMAQGMRRQQRVHEAFDRIEAAWDDRARGGDRVPVVGFHTSWSGAPASLGMLIAAARGHEDGVLEAHYDFRPRLFWDRARLEAAATERPGIYLFSNYIWSSAANLAHSMLVKELSPHSVTIHGGPNTPKYPDDVQRWFAEHPHVDIAVHGEGEVTFVELLEALRGHVGDGPPDLSPLESVPGLSFRTTGGGAVQTAGRERLTDLNSTPSPLLTGLFDGFIPAGPTGAVVLETNRGCPYGCTFCDWGSATLSRIRKFDLDRIFAELDWCAEHGFETVGIADANFGIFERDVEIAEHIAALKARYGAPRFVGNNYAKNTVKHLSRIIEIFTEAGIVAEGKMSMQSFDTDTLIAIRRKNIKVEKYHDLAAEFRQNELPMVVDIMVGLPGATPATFLDDLQECINRGVRAAIHTTILLPNSPMNEPAYRAEHGIVAQPGEEVRETSSYTRDEWEHMNRLTWAFYVLENFGVLRQVATYVRAETGMREIDFYEGLVNQVHRSPGRWPYLAMTLQVLPELLVPPVSWRFLIEEVRGYLVDELGLADDSALQALLTVQQALHPARERRFPDAVAIDHDVSAWHAALSTARATGAHADWHEQVRPLRSYGPATFVVDDPYDVCSLAVGGSVRSLVVENAWDLQSDISRPRQRLATSEEALAG